MAVQFEIERRRIKVGRDGFFDVRGINADDLVYLTKFSLDDIKAAVAKHGRTGGSIPRDKMADAVLDIAQSFPTLTTEIISRCAEAPEEQDKFRQLPFAITISALKAILELSVEDGGVELKNLAAGLVAVLETNGIHLGPLGTQLRNTIAQSAAT